MRERTTYKPSLIASSDIRRVRMAKRTRQEIHDKNVTFYQGVLKNAKPSKVEITEEYLARVYKEVRYAGTWNPIRKYYGKLVFMFNDNCKFR